MRSSVIGFVTQIILIQRNFKSNRFKSPLPLPVTLLAQSQQLLCKAAPKMHHSNMLAKEIEDSIFPGCEVAKLENLRKRYRFEKAKNTQ